MDGKLSFGFTKKIEKKNLTKSAIKLSKADLDDDLCSKQSIATFDEKEVRRVFANTKKEDLVIPMIADTREAIYEKLANEIENDEPQPDLQEEDTAEEDLSKLSIEERAIKELCLEGKQGTRKNAVKAIQISGPTSSFAETTATGNISALDDYEQVGIGEFGAALLRGMGWQNEGVGKMKRVVNILESTSKSFSGIAAKRKEVASSDNEELILKNGSYVYIHSGRKYKGTYGIVQSIDVAHIAIQPSRGKELIYEVEANFNVVSKNEYQDQSRVINKQMYDEYKGKESDKKDEMGKRKSSTSSSAQASKKHKSSRHRDSQQYDRSYARSETKSKYDKEGRHEERRHEDERKDASDDKSIKPSEKNRAYTDQRETCRQDKQKVKSNKRRDSSEERYVADQRHNKKLKSEEPIEMPAPARAIPWIRENLRVRIINKSYKGGRYHKEKVIVQAIDTIDCCTCVSSDGRELTDLDPACLETVIPKVVNATVMIVKGSSIGQKARILQLEKDKERATLQLLDDQSVVFLKYFDDFSEYVGR